jgi:hypothetical protein
MELQLHDNGLEAFNYRRASSFFPNPYYQAARFAAKTQPGQFAVQRRRKLFSRLLHEAQGTPTYTQFLTEESLTGNEDFDLQASRFGQWIKTKAVPGLQKFQQKLSPIIGMIPGGGAVNAAFDIIKRPDGAPGPAVEPIISPIGPQLPAPMPPPAFFPQPEPTFPVTPQYAGFAPAQPPSGLPFGLDLKTLLLLGIGGIVAYRAFKK